MTEGRAGSANDDAGTPDNRPCLSRNLIFPIDEAVPAGAWPSPSWHTVEILPGLTESEAWTGREVVAFTTAATRGESGGLCSGLFCFGLFFVHLLPESDLVSIELQRIIRNEKRHRAGAIRELPLEFRVVDLCKNRA